MKYFLSTLLSLFLLLTGTVYAETKHDIGIKKFKFTPAEITIKQGDTIRWTNNEKRQYHSVWFEKLGDPEPDYLFPGDFYEKTFNDIGDFPYRCGPHPKMTGLVHVVKAKQQNAPDKKQSNQTSTKTSYKLLSVEDGDTLVIQYKGKPQRVQLIGIDAPEDTQNPKLNLDSSRKSINKDDLLEMGRLASEHLKALVKPDQAIFLKGDLTRKDKYGRLPAIVINNKGESLNQRMVADGYALLLIRFPLNDTIKANLKEAQKNAQENKKGLWGSHSKLMQKWSQ